MARDQWARTMYPETQPEHRQKATTVSWYSSGVACFARSRTATGSTVRAVSMATNTPEPSDRATLKTCSLEHSDRGVLPCPRGMLPQAVA